MADDVASDDIEAEMLHQFEQAELALRRVTAALREARDALQPRVPAALCERLLPMLADIRGLTDSVLSRESVAPRMPWPYREGLLCSIDGVTYWHTGAQYWLAIGSADGPQESLRELPGFKKLAEQFDRYNSVLVGGEWSEAADENAEIAAALALLRVRRERLWWDAVVEFLRAHKGQRVDRALARKALLESGFDSAKVASLLRD